MDARTTRECRRYVCSIQRNLDRAVAENDKRMTREQMSYWAKMKGDYAKREKINLFAVAQMREAESTKSKIDKVIRLRRSHDTMERRRTASAKRATQMVKEGRI